MYASYVLARQGTKNMQQIYYGSVEEKVKA